MRVALVIYGSLDTISGGFLYDQKLVEYLQDQSDQVEIISLPWRSYPRLLLDNLSLALYRRLVSLDVDVLIQDELCHPSLFWINRRLKKRVRYPIVSIVHHLRSSEAHPAGVMGLYRLVEREYLRTNDGFVYNSRTTRQAVEALSSSRLSGVVAFPSGQFRPEIDATEIIVRAHQPGPLKLLFIGNLIPRKGLHTLLDALESMPPGIAELTVVGGYLSDSHYAREMLTRMRTRMRDSKQPGCIKFLGALSREELAGVVRTHHLIAVPSSYEGYGIVYLEGMGYGLPAIATTRGAAGEIITDGQDGYLVPPEDPAALAAVFSSLAVNRDRLAALSLAARRCYLDHPTWEQTGVSIRRFIYDLAFGRINDV
jgi:glycosyltransferase involved in cell wall biosynthesis